MSGEPGGPMLLAELTSGGPIPLAGDRDDQRSRPETLDSLGSFMRTGVHSMVGGPHAFEQSWSLPAAKGPLSPAWAETSQLDRCNPQQGLWMKFHFGFRTDLTVRQQTACPATFIRPGALQHRGSEHRDLDLVGARVYRDAENGVDMSTQHDAQTLEELFAVPDAPQT